MLRIPGRMNITRRKFVKSVKSQCFCFSSGSSFKLNGTSDEAPLTNDTINPTDDDKGNDILFPWRTEKELANSSGFFSLVKSKIAFLTLAELPLDFIPDIGANTPNEIEKKKYWNDEFVKGSEMAFTTATNSIFGGLSNLKEPTIPIITKKEKDDEEEAEDIPIVTTNNDTPTAPSSSSIKANVDMNLIFEEELAAFFSDAKIRADKIGHNITYKMIESKYYRISSCDILIYCCRSQTEASKEMAPINWPFYFIGPITLMIPYELKEHGYITEQQVESLVKQRFDPLHDMVTIRVGVEFDTKEIFHINDKISGALLQGSEEIVDCKHEVIFESTYRKKNRSLGDWLMVDIDDWRSGNKFWMETNK